ncbi:hypothetical protein J1N35_042724 [Gossypium stocksii]|uniref:Uncharacterized protein n=1 Tax=Gossypium stocksii TaxID=47602 RepID=A0A9D3U607_9ROSI|nr:hypothetical protein J1N35_042724 [Gossypium stocksii]
MSTYSRSAPSFVNQVLRAAANGTLALDRAWETKPSPKDNTFEFMKLNPENRKLARGCERWESSVKKISG